LIQAEARLCPNCEKPTSLGSFRCSQCRKPLNPFKAHPQSTQESALFLDPAGNARVILAYCVDGFISVFAIMVLSLTFSVNLDTNIIKGAHFVDAVLLTLAAHLQAIAPAMTIVFGAYIAYQCTALAGAGFTPGRWLAGIVLVHRKGLELSRGRLVIRTLLSLVSWASFGAGYFLPILDPYHRTFHDICCQTILVKRRLQL
jgi:uncharacterized RDD family membrane protein YckC